MKKSDKVLEELNFRENAYAISMSSEELEIYRGVEEDVVKCSEVDLVGKRK